MNLAICSLASGSSGNCYLVYSKSAAVLVDAGISGRQIFSKLEALGLKPDQISALMVTHEHSDHIKGLAQAAKKTGARIYASRGTSREFPDELRERTEILSAGDSLRIEDMKIKCFSISHDAAEPLAYSFFSGDKQISIVTDTGVLTEEILKNIEASDILVLESNHDENILRMGRYPWFLKQRILSEHGHLSNEGAARGLLELLRMDRDQGSARKRQVLLAHLSKENNFPEMALTTVKNVLEEEGFYQGKHYQVNILSRSEASPVYWI